MLQYKEELQSSCLQLLLSLPSEIVYHELDNLIPSLQVRGGVVWLIRFPWLLMTTGGTEAWSELRTSCQGCDRSPRVLESRVAIA